MEANEAVASDPAVVDGRVGEQAASSVQVRRGAVQRERTTPQMKNHHTLHTHTRPLLRVCYCVLSRL